MMRHPRELDRPLAELVAKLPKSVKPVMVFASFIAAPIPIGIIFLLLIVFSLLTSNDQLFRAALIGIALSPVAEISKFISKRRRPETLYVERMMFKTYSFPSGHSYISVLVFGFLAALAFLTLPNGYIITIVLSALAITVGISRVYLGAHFPSDVLAGWILGCLALTFWIKVGL